MCIANIKGYTYVISDHEGVLAALYACYVYAIINAPRAVSGLKAEIMSLQHPIISLANTYTTNNGHILQKLVVSTHTLFACWERKALRAAGDVARFSLLLL